jgi:xylulokinase
VNIFTVNDYLAFRMTGEKVNNPSNAGGMQLVDIRTGAWSDTVCDLVGISPGQLSKIQPTGSVIGKIKPEICRAAGLTPGVVLVNGCHDQVSTAVGLGLNDPGKILTACGTAWVITGIADQQSVLDVPEGMDLNFHAQPSRWTVSQSLGGLGAALEWWVEQVWEGERSQRFRALSQELTVARNNPQLLFLPVTGGVENPATVSSGGFWGIQLGQTRAEMALAIMESSAFELKLAFEEWERQGILIDCIWLVGGAASSVHWLRVLTDTCQLPIQIPEFDSWPALGAAVIAGVGVGWFSHLQQGAGCFAKPCRILLPDVEKSQYYVEKKGRYQRAKNLIQAISNQQEPDS